MRIKAKVVPLVVVVTLLLVSGCSNDDQPKINIGDVGILHGTGTIVAIGISEAAFDEFLDAEVAKDKEGHAQMLMMGTIFAVKNGTKVRLIDVGGVKYGVMKVKIRVLEGKMRGRAGYVSKEEIKPLQDQSK